MNEQIKAVNQILRAGEPGNISVDEHSGYIGYRPQSIIDAMNEVFWGAWGFVELSSEIVPGDKGALAIAQVQVWLKDIDFRPPAWGQNRVTRGDVGDAKKGAQTDAIKKALSYFSIGNRAYLGELQPAQPRIQQNGNKPAQPKRATEETKPQSSESPVYREVYLAGGKKHLWSNQSGFYAFASAELGIAVSADNVKLLDSEQIAQLMQA